MEAIMYGLILQLYQALKLTKCDVERNGFKYGGQSNCNKALAATERFMKKYKSTTTRTEG